MGERVPFRCRKLDRFVHGRVLFIGDSAHQVSPFGARGANGAVQGVENLIWKLVRVMRNEARRRCCRLTTSNASTAPRKIC